MTFCRPTRWLGLFPKAGEKMASLGMVVPSVFLFFLFFPFFPIRQERRRLRSVDAPPSKAMRRKRCQQRKLLRHDPTVLQQESCLLHEHLFHSATSSSIMDA